MHASGKKKYLPGLILSIDEVCEVGNMKEYISGTGTLVNETQQKLKSRLDKRGPKERGKISVDTRVSTVALLPGGRWYRLLASYYVRDFQTEFTKPKLNWVTDGGLMLLPSNKY